MLTVTVASIEFIADTTNLQLLGLLVVPTSKLPLESIRARSAAAVAKAMVLAAGKKIPVVAPPVVPTKAGAAAEPAAMVVTPVTAKVVAMVSAAVLTTPGVLIPVEPFSVIVMFVPYKIVQTEPDGTVTVIPLSIVRGPALMAFLSVVMV